MAVCLVASLGLLPLAAPAFSSAENAAHFQPAQHLGYLAFAKEGQLDAIKALPKPELAGELLSGLGIQDLRMYSVELDGRTVLFARHASPKDTCINEAWNKAMAHKVLGPWLEAEMKLVDAHPRAAAVDRSWLPLEQVFYYHGADDRPAGHQARACAAVTGLKPEMEFQYRTLHQTAWPAVLDAIQRANIANFSIYLVEIGEQLYLFYYFDYVGDDFDGDMAGCAKDPATLRWWKHTDPCQLPLPDAAAKKKIWTDLTPVK